MIFLISVIIILPSFRYLRKMAFCSWVKQEIYRDEFSSGMYVCSKCEYPLFSR